MQKCDSASSVNSDTKMSFEDLRKSARQLESEIDVKLVAFSKLAAIWYAASASNGSNGTASANSDQEPLLSTDQKYETICMELDHLLKNLSEMNEKMNHFSINSSYATIHTIERHKDILQDYSREFERTNSTLVGRRERQQLLSGARNDELITGLSRRDLFIKESDHLASSERLIDAQMGVAAETRDQMRAQRDAFKRIQAKVNDLGSRFPRVNALLSRISLRRRRDAVVIGAVVALVATFSLWWLLA